MTKSDISRLTSNQLKTLPWCLDSKSYDEACKQSNISRETLYRWLKEPLFKSELDRLRNEVFSNAINRLKANTTKAVDVLSKLMDRDDCPAVQRAACNAILNHTAKYRELEEFEKRLQAIEEQVARNKSTL